MKKLYNLLILLSVTFIFTACSNNNSKVSESLERKELLELKTDATMPHTKDLSNAIFRIELDDRFTDKYDTVVAENYIEIYDLESRSHNYNGLLFSICAFENPDEWAGGPHEKVGELTLNNGKLYDIIIGYPTESQYGFDTDMPITYKTLYDARYDVAKTLTGLNGEKISFGTGVTGENMYAPIITKLIDALNNNYDSNQFEAMNFSPMYGSIRQNNNNYLDKIGYAYKDINVDGIDELLIGEIDAEDEKCIIYDLYTMVDRKPAHVLSGWGRNRYYAVNGSFLINEYSNSAFESGVTVYALTTNSTELVFQLGLKYDESEDANSPYYISYNKTGDEYDWEKTEEEQFNEMLSRFDVPSDFKYNKLSDFK